MYKIFEKLSNSKGVTPYFVSKETGVAVSTLSAWKQGRYHPKDEKLELIAEYFDVPLAYLKGQIKAFQCPVCHMEYSPADEKSYAKHIAYHDHFKEIEKHFRMPIPSRGECEQKRINALMVLRDIKYDKFRRISSFSEYAKYDFLLNLYESDFDTDIDVDVHTKSLAEKIRPDNAISLNLCNAIRAEFGVDEYKENLSANITEKEYQIIRKYRKLSEEAAHIIDMILDAYKGED